MTTKELIQAEIDNFSEDTLKKLHIIIQQFSQSKQGITHHKQRHISELEGLLTLPKKAVTLEEMDAAIRHRGSTLC